MVVCYIKVGPNLQKKKKSTNVHSSELQEGHKSFYVPNISIHLKLQEYKINSLTRICEDVQSTDLVFRTA